MIKKRVFVAFVVMIVLFCFSFICAEIRINEVELNPNDSCNDCTEWLELYSSEEINVTGWKIIDADNNSQNLTGIMNGYYIITNPSFSLNNANEQLFLYNGSIIVINTSIISDSFNDNRTWQYCFGNWTFQTSTEGGANNCSQLSEVNNLINQTTNSTNQTSTNNTANIQKISPYMELDWDEEDIVNGQEFYIDIKFFNLEDKNYDLKLWISSDNNDNSISDRYDENESKWESGIYWLNNFIHGGGNKTSEVSLRIRSSYKNFYGDARIFAKMRVSGDSDIINSTIRDITINKNQTNSATSLSATSLSNSVSYVGNSSSPGLIVLGSSSSLKTEDIKTQGNTIYKSKSEYMAEYAPYIMNILCIFVIFILLFKNYSLIKENKRNKKFNIRNGK